ncbi:hypothetical protein M2161_004096 [Streptomyces sp. SAI-133]|nr:hypothetical protein [Streptomyces sp. SAI-133]
MSQTARGPSLSLAGRPGRRARHRAPGAQQDRPETSSASAAARRRPDPTSRHAPGTPETALHHASSRPGQRARPAPPAEDRAPQAPTGHTRNRAPPRQQQAGTTSTSGTPGRRPGATSTHRTHPKPRFTPHPAAGPDNEHVHRPRPKTGRHKHPPDTPETALHPAPAAGRDNEHVHRPRPKTGRHKHPPDTPKAPLHPAPSSRPGQRARPVPGARAAVPYGRPPPRAPGHAKPRAPARQHSAGRRAHSAPAEGPAPPRARAAVTHPRPRPSAQQCKRRPARVRRRSIADGPRSSDPPSVSGLSGSMKTAAAILHADARRSRAHRSGQSVVTTTVFAALSCRPCLYGLSK